MLCFLFLTIWQPNNLSLHSYGHCASSWLWRRHSAKSSGLCVQDSCDLTWVTRRVFRVVLSPGVFWDVLWCESASILFSDHSPSQDRLVGIHHKGRAEGSRRLWRGRQSRRISFFTIKWCDVKSSVFFGSSKIGWGYCFMMLEAWK